MHHTPSTTGVWLFLHASELPPAEPVWIHAFSQSFACNSETHHRFLASTLPFDLFFFVRSFMIAILCYCFISSSSVNSSCLLCKRCKLYSPNKAKILAQQSSHHLLIFFLLFLRTLLNSKGSPLPLKAPLLLSSTLYLSRTSSFIFATKFFQHRSISLWFFSSLPCLPPQRCLAFPSFLQQTILVRSSILLGFSPFYLVTFAHLPQAQVLLA